MPRGGSLALIPGLATLYNTVYALLAAGARGVLVPGAEPVQEQLIQARHLASRGCFRIVEPGTLAHGRWSAPCAKRSRRPL
jgi:predicted glycosyltransferase